jgi:hypothetical protein
MRGIPELNFPVFHEAAALLRSQGHEVFSPAEIDNPTDDRKALEIELAWICRHAEAIALLPGWENSRGAKAERAVGEALGLKIIDLVNL